MVVSGLPGHILGPHEFETVTRKSSLLFCSVVNSTFRSSGYEQIMTMLAAQETELT